MKTSVKVKGKGPRVLANTIKKPEKSLNLSGSFLNKSTTHRYITDLRNNNARLAHSLASQKKQSAEIFQRYTECQAILMGQKAFLRNVSYSIKRGVDKFKSAVDLMFDASATFMSIHNKIISYCPELEEQNSAPAPGNQVDGLGLPGCQPQPSTTILSNASNDATAAGSDQAPIPITVPQSRQGTARPMVQGQVISNPTISLQRVVVPTRNLGRAVVKPDRGVHWLSINGEMESRLSVVPEELNASNRSEGDSQRTVSTHQSSSLQVSDNNLRLSMPPSHVVLERLSPIVHLDLSNQLIDDAENQLTAVNFGSYNFSSHNESKFTSESISAPSPESGHCVKNSTNTCNEVLTSQTLHNSPLTSKSALNTSNSDDYLTESSSEDEDLALQIVESKKYYLERSRQVDSKEGTSWNYDEDGKFHGRPPKRKRSKKDQNLVKEKKCPETKMLFTSKGETSGSKTKNSSHSKLLRGPETGKVNSSELNKQTTSNTCERKSPSSEDLPDCSSQALSNERNICKHNVINDQNSPNDQQNECDALMDTVLDVQDMSLTECIKLTQPLTAAATTDFDTSLGNSRSKDKHVGGNTVNQQLSDREIYVTKRSRGRKPSSENVQNEDFRSSSSLPLNNSLKKTSNSLVENIENSPPVTQNQFEVVRNSNLEAVSDSPCMVSTNQQDLSQLPSYVVLERLPHNVLKGHSNQNATSNCENVRAIKRKKSSRETKSIPVQQGSPQSNTSLQISSKNDVDDRGMSRKRNFGVSSSKSETGSDIEEDSHSDKARNLPSKLICKDRVMSRKRNFGVSSSKSETGSDIEEDSHNDKARNLPSKLTCKDRVMSRNHNYEVSSSKSETGSDIEEDSHHDKAGNLPSKLTSKPQPKQLSRSKDSRRKCPDKKSTEAAYNRAKSEPSGPPVNSAPSSATNSPQSSSLKLPEDGHLDLEHEHEGHRPRRNAAPTSLKEQRLNKKLRRP